MPTTDVSRCSKLGAQRLGLLDQLIDGKQRGQDGDAQRLLQPHCHDSAGFPLLLEEFSSVVVAVECAVAIQNAMAQRNAYVEEPRRMQFRIGINQGDIIHDETRVYGDGVNVAARLESIAEPGGICISAKVHDEIGGKMNIACQDFGMHQLKNITQPVRVYRIELFRNSPKSTLALPEKPS